MRIVSITSSRADVGVLRPVWSALARSGADVHVIATGMHRLAGAPAIDLEAIEVTLHTAGADLGGRADAAAAAAIGTIVGDCGALYASLNPDVVLVTGDRLDMLPAAVAALPFNLPLAHLHGGEVTEGAIDDRARHAMSKLARLHLVSCASAAGRLRGMGIDHWRIVVTGAPGLDTLLAAPQIDRKQFLVEIGFGDLADAGEDFLLATVHPETNAHDPQAPLAAVLHAIDLSGLPVLFTAPNSDPGGAEMMSTLKSWARGRKNVRLVDTLGPRLYPNALRHAAAMVGNSSSGIIEAGLFGLPVVDVGDRQKGRERGSNVISVANASGDVADALRAIVGRPRYPSVTLYGTGRSGPAVAKAIFAEFDSRSHGDDGLRRAAAVNQGF
ncbi:MAG: UDP-N-acetylglucosamine 2-epimerase [Hyphomicrobium sp.]